SQGQEVMEHPFVQSPQQLLRQPCHPFDKPDEPTPSMMIRSNSCSSAGSMKKGKDKTKSNNTSIKAKGAFSAFSRRFSPTPPSRSHSTPSACTLRTIASTPAFVAESESADAASWPQLSGQLPDSLSLRDQHIRHHSISDIPSQDSKSSQSTCTSSCSASSATSSTSSSSTCSAATTSSSSPFFSPSAFYNTLFGNNNNNINTRSQQQRRLHHNHPNHHTDTKIATSSTSTVTATTTTSSTAPNTFLPSESTVLTAPIPVSESLTLSSLEPTPDTTLDLSSKMGATRQVRSASCTPSFSFSSLSLSKDTSSKTRSDSLSSSKSQMTPLEIQAQLQQQQQQQQLQHQCPFQNPKPSSQPMIHQRSNPIPSTSQFPTLPSSSTYSPTSLPPLPVFPSLSCSSTMFSSTTSPSISHTSGQSLLSGSHSTIPVELPLSIESDAHGHAAQSFEAGSSRLEMSLPGIKSSNIGNINGNRSLLPPPPSPKSSTFNPDSSNLTGSRRSSKDSLDSVPGVTLDELVDRLTIPDADHLEYFVRMKIFLMIYRKFLRPRELLEMLIQRFEELGDCAENEDEKVVENKNNTRDSICMCLRYWLRNYPNDLIHRQTRQRLASFLRERVALFPRLSELYAELVPLSSIQYFQAWRWPQGDHSDSRSSSISGPSLSGLSSDDDNDSGFYDATGAMVSEQDMDEDREWGLFDDEDILPEAKKCLGLDSLAPFPQAIGAGINSSNNSSRVASRLNSQLPRDRRSSTGSLAHASPCAMEAFVASRRGSGSSVNSNNQNMHHTSFVSPLGFTEGDSALFQHHQQQLQHPQPQLHQPLFQPMISIPFIGKRSSSQAYRQKQQQNHGISPAPSPLLQGTIQSNASLIFKETIEDGPVHPLQGRASPLPPPIDYLSVNTPFIEIKDGAIAAQLTCVEFGLFRKLKPRDMLRQILRDMGNFNTTMAIIGAMNTSSIHRLVQTREHLQGKEAWTTFKELEHLMSSERSFFEYRQALKVQKLPCIPYLGVHLGDLLSISEGNRDLRQDGTIHWQKFCLLTDVISMVMQFQSEPYVIQPDPFISRVITDTHVLDDEELYTKSVGTEPGKLHHSRSLSKFNFF
ncbi:hypothetical protein BGX21_008930, partial [Mortierella sp. AD011]